VFPHLFYNLTTARAAVYSIVAATYTMSKTMAVPRLKSFRSQVFVLSCQRTYTHTHIYTTKHNVLAISALPYYVFVVADNNRIPDGVGRGIPNHAFTNLRLLFNRGIFF